MKEYNLSEFLKSENENREGVIVLGDKKFIIKKSAWALLTINNIWQKNKDNEIDFVMAILLNFLGQEGVDFVKKNVNELGKIKICHAIFQHLGIDIPDENEKKN